MNETDLFLFLLLLLSEGEHAGKNLTRPLPKDHTHQVCTLRENTQTDRQTFGVILCDGL